MKSINNYFIISMESDKIDIEKRIDKLIDDVSDCILKTNFLDERDYKN